MPRKARTKAESGIYHVMLRGINCQQIFDDEEDNQTFLQILREYKTICGYQIMAYCLMSNHVHLLIKEGSESLEQTFKRIGAKFVYWYNAKYRRIGHLFQDRFKSEVVENIKYLCTVIRYIHQNPIKAGLCNHLEDYPYSSFSEYLGRQDIVDLDCVEQYVSVESLVEMSREYMTEECLEMRDAPPRRVTDQQAKQLMKQVSGCDNPSAFQALAAGDQEKSIQRMKSAGVSVRQISRLTGATYYVIQKISN